MSAELQEKLKNLKAKKALLERLDANKGEGPKWDSLRVYKNSGEIAELDSQIQGVEIELQKLQGKDSKKST